MGFWKTFWACLLAIVASSVISFIFSMIVFVSFITAIVSSAENEAFNVRNNSVLVVDLSEAIVEEVSSNPMDYFSFNSFSLSTPTSIAEVSKLVNRAALDPKIRGIYIKVPLVVGSSTVALYELRTALENFKERSPEKFIISYGDAYSQSALYLTSVASKVCINPVGVVDWTGMAVNPTFYKGTLDKLGIEPEIIRNGKFKGAVEPFMLTSLSPENREQYQSLINSNWNYIVSQIAASRSVTAESLQKAAEDLSIQSSYDAHKAGLVDELLYLDQVYEWIENELDVKKINTVSLKEYRRSGVLNYSVNSSRNKIEVIYASGEIVDMKSGSGQIVGYQLAEKIAKARNNDRVKAIVLRVNSPGGSAIASEVIYREVALASKEKPVIISMGEYAASGGYWISAPATAIVSSPMTLTGSIGVFGLMFNAQKGAKDILGITFDPVKTAPAADMASMVRPLTPLERRYMQNRVDTIYHSFLSRVSEGRDMTTSEVDSIGQGRIWSGLQGLNNGLVDKIGTLDDAIELAAKKADIEGDYSVLSPKKSENPFFEIFIESAGGVIANIMPSSIESKAIKYVEKLKEENGSIKARTPFDFEIVY